MEYLGLAEINSVPRRVVLRSSMGNCKIAKRCLAPFPQPIGLLSYAIAFASRA
jgi:hypothetical protein